MSTIPDPRSRAMSPASAAGQDATSTSTPRHPDLDDEVTTLSTKLINAINHQTTLDDNLAAARMDLDNARARIRQLETTVDEQREILAGDVWIKRKTAEAEKATLAARIADEKRARLDMEQQKKKIEQELENLTTALFEEANKMVISAKEEARAEQDALQRKNDQLRAQLADTEGLLRSQQEQLVELKQVMEQLAVEREEQSRPPTVPSSPGLESFDSRDTAGLSVGTRHQSLSAPLSPSYPTSFTHLLHPVLRTDLAVYADFKELLRTSKRLSAARFPGGSPSAAAISTAASPISAASASTSSLAATPPATSPQTPITPASSIGSSPFAPTPVPLPHLKETKFYKRVLTEDIEPTLRLDTAPGLSWLARRSALASMTDGSLVVEPTPSTATGRFGKVIKPELYPCSLCGEARRTDEYLRTHRFRISEADTTQVGHPLCRYCLGRVRSTCEFLGFLRIVKDGHWRADDEDAEKVAWEESVRLREQMFWSRIGGGVVPVGGHGRHLSGESFGVSVRGERSPRPSGEGMRGVGVAKRLPELPREVAETVQVQEAPAVAEAVQETPPVVEASEKPAVAPEVVQEPAVPAESVSEPAIAKEAVPEPAVATEAAPEPAVTAEAEQSVATETTPEPAAAAETTTEPTVAAETTPEPAVVVVATPEPAVVAETTPELAAAAEAAQEEPAVVAESTPEPTPATEAAQETAVVAETVPEPAVAKEAAPSEPTPAAVEAAQEPTIEATVVPAAAPEELIITEKQPLPTEEQPAAPAPASTQPKQTPYTAPVFITHF